jgi:hypothetical protein
MVVGASWAEANDAMSSSNPNHGAIFRMFMM